MLGSTNYLERLDAGISKRPGRFDRKYHFTLPAAPERVKYCNYWRNKLAKNKSIDFPPKLSEAIAEITEGFSFAYLKETYVIFSESIFPMHTPFILPKHVSRLHFRPERVILTRYYIVSSLRCS